MRSVPSHICKPPSEASLAHKLLHSYPHSLVNGPSDVPSTLSSLLLPPSQLFLFPFQRRPGVGSQRSLVLEPGGLGADRSGLTYGRGDLGGSVSPKFAGRAWGRGNTFVGVVPVDQPGSVGVTGRQISGWEKSSRRSVQREAA